MTTRITQEADELVKRIISAINKDVHNLEDLSSLLGWAQLQTAKAIKLANAPTFELKGDMAQEFNDSFDEECIDY